MFNYTVCFTPDVHSRVVLLFSSNFPCNFGLYRESIKVGTRFSRQTRTSSACKWVSGKLIWNLARKYTLPTSERTNGQTHEICARSSAFLHADSFRRTLHETELGKKLKVQLPVNTSRFVLEAQRDNVAVACRRSHITGTSLD